MVNSLHFFSKETKHNYFNVIIMILYLIGSLFGTFFQAHVVQKNADMPVQPKCVPNQQVARKTKLAVAYPLVVIHQNL